MKNSFEQPSPLSNESSRMDLVIDPPRKRFPFCVVWTPIPLLSYIFPVIGHTGIATSTGIIRDFAGPYYVSEDDMAFGQPTKYWQLNYNKAKGSIQGWDMAVSQASEIYKTRMHNLCCDNCHSHVATALNLMSYDGSRQWNMVRVAILLLIYGRYVSFYAFLKTWLPFVVIVSIITSLCIFI